MNEIIIEDIVSESIFEEINESEIINKKQSWIKGILLGRYLTIVRYELAKKEVL